MMKTCLCLLSGVLIAIPAHGWVGATPASVNVDKNNKIIVLDGTAYLRQGDMLLPAPRGRVRRDAPSAVASLWPDNTVYYQFDPGASQATRTAIGEAIRSIETHSAVRFVQGTGQGRFVRVSTVDGRVLPTGYDMLPSGFCGQARVGMKNVVFDNNGEPRGQILEISDRDNGACVLRRTALHEMMHALGFHHEHQRPDRDDYLQVGGSGPNAEILGEIVPEGAYDYDSIMHYSTTRLGAGLRDPNIDVSRLGSATLSARDIAMIARAYPATGSWDGNGPGEPGKLESSYHYPSGPRCLEARPGQTPAVRLESCRTPSIPEQLWTQQAGRLKSQASAQFCLATGGTEKEVVTYGGNIQRADVTLARCDDAASTQRWRSLGGPRWINKAHAGNMVLTNARVGDDDIPALETFIPESNRNDFDQFWLWRQR